MMKNWVTEHGWFQWNKTKNLTKLKIISQSTTKQPQSITTYKSIYKREPLERKYLEAGRESLNTEKGREFCLTWWFRRAWLPSRARQRRLQVRENERTSAANVMRRVRENERSLLICYFLMDIIGPFTFFSNLDHGPFFK